MLTSQDQSGMNRLRRAICMTAHRNPSWCSVAPKIFLEPVHVCHLLQNKYQCSYYELILGAPAITALAPLTPSAALSPAPPSPYWPGTLGSSCRQLWHQRHSPACNAQTMVLAIFSGMCTLTARRPCSRYAQGETYQHEVYHDKVHCLSQA